MLVNGVHVTTFLLQYLLQCFRDNAYHDFSLSFSILNATVLFTRDVTIISDDIFPARDDCVTVNPLVSRRGGKSRINRINNETAILLSNVISADFSRFLGRVIDFEIRVIVVRVRRTYRVFL